MSKAANLRYARFESSGSGALDGADIPNLDDIDDLGDDGFSRTPAMGVNHSLDELESMYNHGNSTQTVVNDEELSTSGSMFEFDEEAVNLPQPDIFNAYPPEVQRKIMEWIDRDIRARRDDEAQRQDAILRANIGRERLRTTVPVSIIILCIICAAITGIVAKSAIFVVSFLVVALAMIIVFFAGRYFPPSHTNLHASEHHSSYNAAKK